MTPSHWQVSKPHRFLGKATEPSEQLCPGFQLDVIGLGCFELSWRASKSLAPAPASENGLGDTLLHCGVRLCETSAGRADRVDSDAQQATFRNHYHIITYYIYYTCTI